MGYVLSQLGDDGKVHPKAYGGRALHINEFRWHITDKKGIVLVEALKQYRLYLANTSITVYTDNISVKWLKQIIKLPGKTW